MEKMILVYIAVFYVLMSLILFITMAVDKRKAVKNKWRVREATLFILGLIGGAPGGLLAMKLIHHKNRKYYFYIIFIGEIVLHIAGWYLIVKYLK